jgi:poly-gamma-glutamate capsule biosynthesis protein CapA/YwtB (metallophosphatase superfamily)
MTVIALAGDLLVTRRLSAHTAELEPVASVFRAAHCGFGNLETVFHDFEHPPMPASGGTWLRSPPAVAEELRALGFGLVSLANNHAMDYGWGALSSTMRALDGAGIAHSGAGKDLAEARSPAYLQTSAGRIALVSATSAFAPGQPASPGGHGIPGRAGSSCIRSHTSHTVPEDDYLVLRRMQEALAGRPPPTRYVRIGEFTFRPGDGYASTTLLDQSDVAGFQEVVEEAAAQADHTIVSIHSHDAGETIFRPSDVVAGLCRAAAEAGAGLVACHGPHVIRGAEVYRDCAILYGLGSFFFQNRGLGRYPLDARAALGLDPDATPGQVDAASFDFDREDCFWDAITVESRWSGQRVQELTVHPVAIKRDTRPGHRGLPALPAPGHGGRILEMFRDLCLPHGTAASLTGATATIRL